MIWTIIIFVVIVLVVRALRSVTEWVDYIVWGLLVIGFIVFWIASGFWNAVLFGVIGAIAATILLGSGKTIKQGNKEWFVECSKCGYNYYDILEDEGSDILIKCKRCGNEEWHHLRNRQ